MKKTIAIALAILSLLLSLAGCGTKEENTLETFLKAENSYNADIQNAVAKYGSMCVSTSCEYADGSTESYDTFVDGDTVVVAMDEGWYYIRTGDEWYCYFFDENGNPLFSKYVTFDENYDLDPMYENPGFLFDSGEDYDITLVENEDGSFTWTSSFPFDNGIDKGTATATVYLNPSYEITAMEGTYYAEDGSILSSHKDTFTPGVETEEPVAALAEALEKADGQTRHLTYNAVEDGVITETLEVDVPLGFYCTAVLPPEYYDEEENIYYFTDIGLTQEYVSTDPYGDLDIYFSATGEAPLTASAAPETVEIASGEPLCMEDFIIPEGEAVLYVEGGNYYAALDDYASDEGELCYMLYYVPGVDESEAGILTTARGICLGDTKQAVTDAYGDGTAFDFDPAKDDNYRIANEHSGDDITALMEERCASGIQYRLEGTPAAMTFYFDGNNELTALFFTWSK